MRFFKNILRRESFSPSWISLFINPFYFARRELHAEINALSDFVQGKVLDVGCGTKPYESLFLQATEYFGLEIDSLDNRQKKRADFFYNGKEFPFSDECFNSLVVNQVFEHVFEPELFLAEMSRVMITGGTALVTVPFVWDEHEQPYDFARYTSFGLKALFEKNNFEIIAHRKTAADARVLFQMLNAYIFKATVTSRPLLNLLSCLFFMAPFNLLGITVYKWLPKNSDLYLDNVIVIRKKVSV